MIGDERARYCTDCQRNVYNFAQMTKSEVERVLTRVSKHPQKERVCARITHRPDGSLLTLEDPATTSFLVGASRVAGAALTALLSTGAAMSPSASAKQNAGLIQIADAMAGGKTQSAEKPKTAAEGLKLKVLDEVGAAVPGAMVTILNENTKAKHKVVTDTDGQLWVPDLTAGTYQVTVELFGYKTVRRNHVEVPAKSTLVVWLQNLETYSISLGFVMVPEIPKTALVKGPLPAGQPTAPGGQIPTPTGLRLEVVDASGASIVGAKVRLFSEETKESIETKTDSTGQAWLANLPAGTYDITIEANGFSTLKHEHVQVPTKDSVRLQMEVAATMGEVIEIKPKPARRFFSKLRHLFG